jgi:hypothetical protein
VFIGVNILHPGEKEEEKQNSCTEEHGFPEFKYGWKHT